MVSVVNVFEDDWGAESSRPGFEWRALAVGDRLGAELLGAGLYELPPGQKTWPHHLHHANEEWLIALAGAPTLRTPDGERELAPGDVVPFLRGTAGAHQVINRGGEPARILIVSTKVLPEITEYPDSGKVGIRPLDGERRNLRADAELDYWEGEA
jgi:uncharacterized cupin superfamily protein